MKRIILKGVYNKHTDRVTIKWRHYNVMEVINISKNYDISDDKMVKKVIDDHREIAKDIVIDFLENNY